MICWKLENKDLKRFDKFNQHIFFIIIIIIIQTVSGKHTEERVLFMDSVLG